MTATTLPTRAGWLAMLGVLLGLSVAIGAPAAPAAAHAYLTGSDPPHGVTLPDPPEQLVLSFSEPVRPVPDRIVLVGPDGDTVARGEPRAEGGDLMIPLEELPLRGTYLLSYRVISQDSHPVAGSVTFSVGAPSGTPELSVGDDVVDPVVGAAVSVNKYLGYAGVVLVVGPAVALALLWPRRVSRLGASRLVWTGVGLVAVSTVVGVWLQAPYQNGLPLFGASGAAVRDVLASPYGTAHLVRLGVLIAVGLLLRPVLAGRATRSDLLLLGGLGAIGLGTWPFAGHPIASPLPALAVAVGTVHLAAAAFWVGGLVVLAGFLLRLADERELGAILPEWSRWAALAVVVLMLAGLVQAVVEIGPPEALVSTGYGRLLLVKLGLVAVVVAVAGYSRRLVRRRLAASRPGAMRIAVGVEAAVLAGVLVMSSVLVQTTPGRTEAAAPPPGVASSDFATTLETRLYSLQVLVEPTRPGSNDMHLYAFSPEGEPLPVVEWRATAELPAAGVEPAEVELLPLTDNHAYGVVRLPLAGDWELALTLRISEIEQASVRVTVPIR